MHVVLGDPADGPVDERQLHLFALELAQALGHRLERTLGVGLEDQVERGRLAPLDLLEDVLELGAGPGRRGRLALVGRAEALLALLGDVAGRLRLVGDPELVAGRRNDVEAEHLDRRGGRRLLDVVALVVDQGLDPAPGRAGHDGVADPEGALLDDDGGHRAPARRRGWLRGRRRWPALGVGHAALRSRPPTSSCSSRSSMPKFCRAEISTMIVSPPHCSGTRPWSESCCMTRLGSALSRSILLMATMIGTSAALGVVDGLDGLGHDAVVGGHDQDDDVGDLGAPGPHGGEGLVARGVDEGDQLAVGSRPGRRRCAG